MAAFGVGGYFAHHYDERMKELLAEMRAEIKGKRAKQVAAAEEAGNEELVKWLKERI
jgi:hypothetical protein